MEYKVTQKEIGQRVDIFFMSKRSDLTRAFIKELFVNGVVKVNGKNVLPNYKVKNEDSIDFDEAILKEKIKTSVTKNILKPVKLDLVIIFEDKDILVLDKPAGLNVHPVVKHDSNTLLNGATYYLLNETKFELGARPRLVHRLDKDTSGVVLLSKNTTSQDFYSKLFENREVKKTYNAVVFGDFHKFMRGSPKLTLETYISTTHDDLHRYKNTSSDNGRLAKTDIFFENYVNLNGIGKCSLLRLEPKTGRTHQLRVHLSSIGYPIVGDRVYGGRKYKRLMLNASELEIPKLEDKGSTLKLKSGIRL